MQFLNRPYAPRYSLIEHIICSQYFCFVYIKSILKEYGKIRTLYCSSKQIRMSLVQITHAELNLVSFPYTYQEDNIKNYLSKT